MTEQKEYLTNLLKQSGIKTAVYTSYKRLETAGETHVGAVIPIKDNLKRVRSKTKYVDQQGQHKTRWKLWERTTIYDIVIADNTDEKVDVILVNFLLNLKKGIAVDDNWEDIDLSEIEWYGAGDTILKSKIAARFQIAITGGIYRDSEPKILSLGEVFEDRQEEQQ